MFQKNSRSSSSSSHGRAGGGGFGGGKFGGRSGGKSGGKFGSKFGGKFDGRRREKKDDVLMARFRKKTCRFCEEKVIALDYKDLKRTERLVSERGKMLSRRVTGVCAKHQRMVEESIKRARFMALLPFLKK
ncbi:MAG: 30S ribosomal protein S18 [Candidatus Omnitrophica bacterium CG1_02_44_16]|nr:MAG: 30S ribosomal protein S18 [Candidatus Omnitrophica bacterium CG1_02_44_16]